MFGGRCQSQSMGLNQHFLVSGPKCHKKEWPYGSVTNAIIIRQESKLADYFINFNAWYEIQICLYSTNQELIAMMKDCICMVYKRHDSGC